MSETDVHVGKVTSLKKGKAYVEIMRSAACEGCKACFFSSRKKSVVLPALNDAGAAENDTVELKPPPPRPYTAFLVLFVLPAAALLAGIIVSAALSLAEPLIISSAFIGLAAGLLAVFLLDRLYYSKKYISRIVGIVEQKGEQTK